MTEQSNGTGLPQLLQDLMYAAERSIETAEDKMAAADRAAQLRWDMEYLARIWARGGADSSPALEMLRTEGRSNDRAAARALHSEVAAICDRAPAICCVCGRTFRHFGSRDRRKTCSNTCAEAKRRKVTREARARQRGGRLTVPQVADLLGISTKTLYRLEEEGFIKPGRNRWGWRIYAAADIAAARRALRQPKNRSVD